MNEQLLLKNVRQVLIRQEETIIFALLERAQFLANAKVYEPGAFGEATEGESLCGYMLRETEKLHAGMRRYTSPDEHPFFDNLPEPILPALTWQENPLKSNNINHNAEIRSIYEERIIPAVCAAGDDSQYGSSAVCDVICLQALSRRIHYGKFVAESKYQHNPELFQPIISSADRTALFMAITDETVEQQVLERVAEKAAAYGSDAAAETQPANPCAKTITTVYRDIIIPMNKQVQVEYLLERLDKPHENRKR